MPSEQTQRTLAVILHADIVGSTALVRRDEQLAHERITDAFKRFSTTIEQYGGTVQEIRGDALLAQFARASDAVCAALAFQQSHVAHRAALGEEVTPAIRVGISMGEVVFADDTATGAGVVLAQRVEQLTQPDGVCITAAIHEAIPDRMPFDQDDLGERQVKGFDEPVRVYAVHPRDGVALPEPAMIPLRKKDPRAKWIALAAAVVLVAGVGALGYLQPWSPDIEPASVERMAYPLPDKPSIAVLPFTNMSDDAEQEYFVDGMTEDLITDLSKVPGLFIIARNSVFTYKDRAVKVRQVAEELGVRYVLEGSVRRVGEKVRINAQLIDATTGGHLWADRYDGSLADVFTLQDKVTQQIVGALALNLTGVEATPLKTVSAQAYDAFLKGWAHYQRDNADDLTQAIPHLQQAIQLDADYAQAHAALAAVYWKLWSNNWAEHLGMSMSEVMVKAKQHLDHGLKEATPLAHWVASNIAISEGNYQQAVSEAKQIVALDSNNPAGYAQLANALELTGRTEESADVIQKAIRLDPYSSPLHTAAQKGDAATVSKLIADGATVDAKDYYGKTPLHVATENGHAEIVASLIEAGADIEKRTPRDAVRFRLFHATPLILAARLGHVNVAELLISAGADVNAKDRSNNIWAVLHTAANFGHAEVAELLIANGAEIDVTTVGRGETPLFQAAKWGHEAVVELLLRMGANVNAPDGNASTPLHVAAISGDLEVVKLLLENGADVNASTVSGANPGETPLHAASYSGDAQVAELLLSNGAKVNALGVVA